MINNLSDFRVGGPIYCYLFRVLSCFVFKI